MREIKIRVPKGHAERIAQVATQANIRQVTSHEVFIHGQNVVQEEVKFKSSTPQTKKFLSALFRTAFFDKSTYSFSSHDMRALVTDQSAGDVTKPVGVPFSEILQDFWQCSHVTTSFVVRTAVSAGLLSYAMIKDDPILSIGAMIFTPFSPLLLSIAFAGVAQQIQLLKQSAFAFGVALLLTVVSAALIASITGGPLAFNHFGSLSTNVVIAAITGLMAAVADADDVGRRQLLGLAMAYPFVKFPTWIGIAMALGFPVRSITCERLEALVANSMAMIASAALAYWAMGRHGELKNLPA